MYFAQYGWSIPWIKSVDFRFHNLWINFIYIGWCKLDVSLNFVCLCKTLIKEVARAFQWNVPTKTRITTLLISD